ncbi:MAG: TIR domain-containing protein [Candidatus Nitrotoga sp.]
MNICPNCDSTHTVFKEKAHQWECLDCEERFIGATPIDMLRRLTDRAENPKHIFFSYGHDANRELVDELRQDLEKRGHQVWIDYKEIGAWDDWKGRITQGIYDTQIAVVFLSKHSTRDPGVCRNEVAMALHRFGSVYPILLEPLSQVSIPLTVTHLQWPDLSRWRDIRDGTVPDIDWGRWYEERLIEVITKIEGECTRFANETGLLRMALRPSTFESKVALHVEGFIGREWVFEAYEEWLNSKPASRIFWLRAGPGFGKSALAANLSHRYRGAIVGTWFCESVSVELNNASQALRTLAFQLALRWDDYRVRVLAQLGISGAFEQDKIDSVWQELAKKNVPDLFRQLFAEPLAGLIWREHKLVIVIDALDEATNEMGGNSLVDLISQHFINLPSWICFVLTSRLEANVVNRLQGFKSFEIDGQDSRNHNDLLEYCQKTIFRLPEFAALTERERYEVQDSLISKSEGMILYLKLVEEGLNEGTLAINCLGQLEGGLVGLYRRYHSSFEHRFGHDYDIEAKLLLRLLMAAPGPLPEDLARVVLDWDREKLLSVHNRIGSYLCESMAGLQIFHKTLREWLADSRSGRFFVAIELGQRQLAKSLWQHFQETENKLHLRWTLQIQDWLPELLPGTMHWDDYNGLVNFGAYLSDSQCFLEGRSILERAIGLREKVLSTDHSVIADCLDKLVLVCIRLADLGYLNESLSTAEVLTASSSNASKLGGEFLRAYCLRRNGRLLEAQTWLNNYDSGAVSDLLPNLKLRIKYQAAHVNHLLGCYGEAHQIYEAIINAPPRLDEEREAYDLARRQLADVSMLRGEFRKALSGFSDCSGTQSSDPLWILECQRFIGHVYRFNWMHLEAAKIYSEIARKSKENGFLGMYGKSLVNLAEVYCWGDPSEAIPLAEQAIEINGQTGNAIEVGKAHTVLALAQSFLGHGMEALAQADKAEMIQTTSGYRSGLVFVEGVRTLTFLMLGDEVRMRQSLRFVDETTQQIGVYRFLSWFYGSICATEVTCNKSDFDWLENSPISQGIKSVIERIKTKQN